jgi:hypothetical protein
MVNNALLINIYKVGTLFTMVLLVMPGFYGRGFFKDAKTGTVGAGAG